MAAKNKVVAGDYENRNVILGSGQIGLCLIGTFRLDKNAKNVIYLDKNTINSYELIDQTKQKSAASAIGRGLVGGFVLGPVGLLAGLSAKSKGTHLVAIQFKDGKKSLLEIDDKIYSALVQKLF